MINLTEVYKVYRSNEIETTALENVNITIDKGEFVSVMGPSGCGKSTLLNVMGLLDSPTSGTVELCGERPLLKNATEVARFRNQHLGFIFQNFHLINSMSVIDNVQLALYYRGVKHSERIKRAKEVLERLEISHRMYHLPKNISGGQAQRVAIARAIVGNPDILFADEPTGNLDSKMGGEVMDILKKLNEEDGRTIVMVTHNQKQAEQTDRIILFADGCQIK
ncbi:MAG: ABC transporter ATP-binding protein [Rikenellaceae bacterium]